MQIVATFWMTFYMKIVLMRKNPSASDTKEFLANVFGTLSRTYNFITQTLTPSELSVILSFTTGIYDSLTTFRENLRSRIKWILHHKKRQIIKLIISQDNAVWRVRKEEHRAGANKQVNSERHENFRASF